MTTYVLVPGAWHGGWLRPARHPAPAGLALQAVRLEGDLTRFAEKSYVYATRWPTPSPFTELHERLSASLQWRTHVVESGHNVMREAPEQLLKVLLSHG